MHTEVEAKFLNVDHNAIRNKLSSVGAKLEQPMRLLRRVTIDSESMKLKDAFVRVRDEGHRTTLTYKQFDKLSVDGAKEFEVEVSDFQQTIDLLAAAGLPHRSFQESRRELWVLEDVEVVLDEWPWLKPYIEIESDDEAKLRRVAKQLGLQWKNAVFGDVMVAYRAEYPHLGTNDTVGNLPEVKFGDPLPEIFKHEK